MRAAIFIALLGVTQLVNAVELRNCRVSGISTEVKCGSISRPLGNTRGDKATIEVEYVVLEAKARRKLPDPVFFLAGGPGQSAIALTSKISGMLGRLNFRRDIVLVDQRGTGRSMPLQCSEIKDSLSQAPGSVEAMLPLLAACRARLVRERGLATEADLALVTTSMAMRDLDAVREQLGFDQINLIGVSYGTRAGLEYARLFPQRVRRLVLDGVAPPDMGLIGSMSVDNQAALDALFVACAKDRVCAEGGDLAKDWRILLGNLPRDVRIVDPASGSPVSFTLTRWMLEGAIIQSLYQPNIAAALPVAIRRARQGDFTALAGLNSRSTQKMEQAIAMGMHFSVVCAEDYPRLTETLIPQMSVGAGNRALYSAVCGQWPRATVEPGFYTIPSISAPTLLLGGGIDPVTPPRHMERISKALGANATMLIAPNLGHNIVGMSPCARDLVYGFINSMDFAQAIASGKSCLAQIPRPGVFVPLGGAAKEIR